MLSILVFAAAIAAAPPATKAPDLKVAPAPVQEIRLYTNRPVPLSVCDGGAMMNTAKVQSPDALRLGDLPKANLERAVLVKEGGCVKPQIIHYGAGR